MLFRLQQEDTLCPQRQYALHPDIPKFPSASKSRTARLSPKSCHKAGKGENTLQYKNATNGRQTPYCPAEDRQLANLLPHRIPKAQTQWDGKSRYKPCQNNDAERASAANSRRPGFPCHIPPAAGAAYKEEWQNLPAFFHGVKRGAVPAVSFHIRRTGKRPYDFLHGFQFLQQMFPVGMQNIQKRIQTIAFQMIQLFGKRLQEKILVQLIIKRDAEIRNNTTSAAGFQCAGRKGTAAKSGTVQSCVQIFVPGDVFAYGVIARQHQAAVGRKSQRMAVGRTRRSCDGEEVRKNSIKCSKTTVYASKIRLTISEIYAEIR